MSEDIDREIETEQQRDIEEGEAQQKDTRSAEREREAEKNLNRSCTTAVTATLSGRCSASKPDHETASLLKLAPLSSATSGPALNSAGSGGAVSVFSPKQKPGHCALDGTARGMVLADAYHLTWAPAICPTAARRSAVTVAMVRASSEDVLQAASSGGSTITCKGRASAHRMCKYRLFF